MFIFVLFIALSIKMDIHVTQIMYKIAAHIL
jgi:hypothetical protein